MPMLRRVRPRKAGGEDRLSALPDELIRLIVSRLDTRTALSTAVLARRWARIPRELPALDFRVSDILPPVYDRTVALRQSNLPRDTAMAEMLDDLMAHCELDTMRAFANGITSFLEADEGGDGDARRRVKTLRLEFFQTHDGGCVDRLIAAAVGAWGVKDLEVVVRPASCYDQAPAYSFPHDCLKDGDRSRLRSLKLGKYCTLPPLHSYGALTTLVLRDMAASTPVDVYKRVFSECTRLQVLHLISCCCEQDCLVVDTPGSEIRELILEECSFMVIVLHDLPMLVRLACCLTNTVELVFGSVPCLTHTNLTFSEDHDMVDELDQYDELDQFLGMSPTMANLVIRFTRRIQFISGVLDMPLLDLKRLLVADLPPNWDITWPYAFLLAAPSLEVLHIHVPHLEEEAEAAYLHGMSWPKSVIDEHPRHHLKELVMIGFTQRHIRFLEDVVSVCTSLHRVVLLKAGYVRYNGLWDWEMVGQQACPWSDDDEMVVRSMIKSGPRPLVELILG